MKTKLFTSLAVLLASATLLMAQAPQGLNYQAVARNSSGDVLVNQPVGLQFTILSGTPTGTVVYKETHVDTTNQFGLFSTVIGSGTVVSGSFAGINWASGPFYLQVALDATGGTSYVNYGSPTQLQSVPYALNAASSSQWSSTGSDIVNNNSTGAVDIFSSDEDIMNITGATGNTSPYVAFSNNGGTYRGYVGIWNDTAGLDVGTGSGNSTGTLNLTTGATPRVTVNPAGLVGIGTTVPSAQLQVVGSDFPQVLVQNSGTTATVDVDAGGGDAAFRCVKAGTPQGVFGWDYVNNDLRMVIYGSSNYCISLAQSNGYVGIGTTTPAYKLDVAGEINQVVSTGNTSAYNTGNAIFENTNTNYARIFLTNGAGTSGGGFAATTSNQINVVSFTGGYIPVNASAFNVNSDITVKKDVQYLKGEDFESCLNQIRSIQSIRFRYNTESATDGPGVQYRPNLHLGVVAQTLPVEVVSKMDLHADGNGDNRPTLGVSLADMDGLLVAGIKALDNQVKEQQQQIADLKQLVETLQNKLGNK